MNRTRNHRILTVLVAGALAVGVSACGRTGGTGAAGRSDDEGSRGGASAGGTATADFGDLKGVCQPGSASGATAQGVTDKEIKVGTVTDFGFTQNREFINAAEVFTKWCNDAGGINGRKLGFNTRDAKLFEYKQRIVEACRQDFLLVGGGGAFDNTGVRDRLRCGLPEIPGQTVSIENSGSDLQVDPGGFNRKIPPYQGYFRWLVTKAFPESAPAVGIIAGDIGATKTFALQYQESFANSGAKVVYNNVYPAAGVSDWTPYAQAIKSAGVKGLAFLGDFNQLAKLEQSLTDIGYKLSWVDANSNAYNKQFIELGGANLDQQPNFSDANIYPLENASANAPTQQLLDLFKKYAPDADVTMPVVRAWSAWLLFATAARDCGAQLTRKCVYEKARANAQFDGAGLHSPTQLSDPNPRTVCFTAERASSTGWKPADIAPNQGVYRCDAETTDLKGNYGKATTLEDVGTTMDAVLK